MDQSYSERHISVSLDVIVGLILDFLVMMRLIDQRAARDKEFRKKLSDLIRHHANLSEKRRRIVNHYRHPW